MIAFIMHPWPSILGGIPQNSGATTRTSGTAQILASRLAGRLLKAGLGVFSRTIITPSTWLSVSPTMFRSPCETLNRPITPRIGTDSPIRASTVRTGRVRRFRQAKRPIGCARSLAAKTPIPLESWHFKRRAGTQHLRDYSHPADREKRIPRPVRHLRRAAEAAARPTEA